MQDPKTQKMIRTAWWLFIIALLGTLVAEHFVKLHPHFDVEGTPYFSAWFGFASCFAIIAVSVLLGKVLKRPSNYYDEEKN